MFINKRTPKRYRYLHHFTLSKTDVLRNHRNVWQEIDQFRSKDIFGVYQNDVRALITQTPLIHYDNAKILFDRFDIFNRNHYVLFILHNDKHLEKIHFEDIGEFIQTCRIELEEFKTSGVNPLVRCGFHLYDIVEIFTCVGIDDSADKMCADITA